jgi:uncharacterized membrane protein YfcA
MNVNPLLPTEPATRKRFTYSLGAWLFAVTALCVFLGVELAFAGRAVPHNAHRKICFWGLVAAGAYLHHRATKKSDEQPPTAVR